jgi:hypothetical protein
MHIVVTAKHVVTYWYEVMKRAGGCEESHGGPKREYDCPVMCLH